MTTGVRVYSQCLIKKNRIKSKNHSADEALGMKGKKKKSTVPLCVRLRQLACRFSKHGGQTTPPTALRGQSSVGHSDDTALLRRQRPKEKHWPGQKVLSLKVLNAFA